MAKEKNNKPVIIGVVAALVVVGAIVAAIILLNKKDDNGGDNGNNQSSSQDDVTATENLIGSNYDKAQLAKIFDESDMTKSTRITAFGGINATQQKDKGDDVYWYYFTPVTDKNEKDALKWKDVFSRYEMPGLVNFDKIEKDKRPKRGDLVKLTGVWKQKTDAIASDNAFELYVESVEIVGEAK